jgi:cold shock protein
MPTGTVKFYNQAKGFGIIIDSQTQEEIFVHASNLGELIQEGDRVTFNFARGQKGMEKIAVEVEVERMP